MSTPTPNTDAAVEFLSRWAPDGPWVLVAIEPDRKGIATRTFLADELRSGVVREFVDHWNGRRNLYFSVNRPRRATDKKLLREDINSLDWLHVDLDPRAGDDLGSERERIRHKLNGGLPTGVPEPTVVIDSGGGYQAFWKLAEPLPLDGSEAAYQEAKRYNLQLEHLFKADSCHNVDRVMRLPGTVNLPNALKRKKGREPALAELVEFNDNMYLLDRFVQAPITEVEPKRAVEIHIDAGDVQRVDDIDSIGLRDYLKVVAVQGDHPDQPKDGDSSRSAWLFDFVCNAMRDGVDDQTVYAIITDPNYKISESVLDKGGRAEQYALKQIRDAREQVAKDAAEFQCDDNGVPHKSQHNIRVALRRLGVTVAHNEFDDRLYIDGRELTDAEMARLWLEVDERFRFRAAKEFFWMVVEDEARRNSFHPVRDYLGSLVWDGVPRIDEWLVKYGAAADTDYVRAVGRLVLVAAVRRVRQPGCKFDEMLVLESPQGELKSTALATLAGEPEWFSDDLPLNADTKVVIERLQGHWIVEAAELKGMRRGEVEHLKSFLSRQVDRARLAYGRLTTVRPRQCVIVGTTNSDRYLKDGTGNRRFWPVAVGRFDVDALRRDRDQLWAEASAAEAAGESIRLDSRHWAAAGAAQESRRVEDPWVQKLADVLGDQTGKLRAEDAWRIVGVRSEHRTQEQNERLGGAMRELGFERRKARFGRGPEWCYARGNRSERQVQIELPLDQRRIGDVTPF